MAGLFDDLQPNTTAQGGMFGDIPAAAKDPGYVETGLRSLARGGLGLASGVGAASEWAGDVTDSPNLRTAGRMIQDTTQKEISEGAGRLEGPAFEGTFEENPSVKRGFSAVAQAVPSLALAVGTGGLAAGGLRAAGVAAPKALAVGSGVAAGGLGVLEGAPQYIEAKEAGKSIGEASAAGAAATVGTALLEYLPISKILGVAGKGALKGGVTGALTEGLQEGAQTVWQNLVAKVGYDDSRSLATGLVESMIGGAGAGGVVGAVVGRTDAAQHTKDRAAETLLKNAFPGTEVSVEGGQAKLIREISGGTTDLAVPLASLAKMMASGVTVDELFSAKAELKAQVDAATTDLPNMDDPNNALAFFEQSIPKEDQAAMADVFDNIRQNNLHKGMSFPQQLFNMVGGVYESRTGKKLDILGGVNEADTDPAPKFARLEDGPDTLRYNIRGKDYAYAPLEGQTVDELRVGVEGKSPAAAVNWLKKNSQLVKEVPNVQPDQVVPEPVVPQAEEVAAPVARGDEAVTGSVPGEPLQAAVQPEQVVAAKKPRKPKGAVLPEVETEIITQADDTLVGKNMSGENLYDRADGSRYRMRTDRPDRPGGYPDFGGDLAPVEEAPKLAAGTETTGQRPSKVKAEIEKKYGALDKVIASGKLNILRAADGLPEGVAAGSEIYSADGKTVVGAYVGGKVYLVADAIAPGEAPGVFLHEVAHRLLDQDTAFKSAKAKIVADFGKLGTQAAKDARAKVPATTPAAAVGEEGLAYFLQTQEGRKSSLWRRLVVAVRSGLRRLGFNMQYTEDDILEMFTAGARSFVQTGGIEGTPVTSPAMMSMREAAKAIFSKLDQVSRASFQGMKAQGVANFLAKQGVKKSEMEAVGLNEWLAAKKPTDKVTQAELVDFVKANTIELEDVVLGSPNQVPELSETGRTINEDGDLTIEYATEDGRVFNVDKWAGEAEYQVVELKPGTGTVLANIALATGGETATETEAVASIKEFIAGRNDLVLQIGDTHFSQYTEPGAVEGSYREMFVTAPGVLKWEDGHSQYAPEKVSKIVEGSGEWKDAANVDRLREQIQDLTGIEKSALASLNGVQLAVLSVDHNEQVRREIVSLLPVDVVNSLADNGITPEELSRNVSVFRSALFPSGKNKPILQGVGGALSQAGALMGTRLRGILSAGVDKELFPALRASQIDSRAAFQTLSDLGGRNSRAGQRGVVSGEAFPATKQAAGTGNDLGPAELARADRLGLGSIAADDTAKLGILPGKLVATEVANLLSVHKELITQKTGQVKNPIVRIRFNEVNADGKRLLRIEEMQGPSKDNQAKMPKHLRENIYQLGVKRILAYAKENGFDGVALATKPGKSAGETQADRYSLEKQVSQVSAKKWGDSGKVGIVARQVGSDDYAAVGEFSPSELDNVVGKELANKIRSDIVSMKDQEAKVYSGLDLKVGGEGLKQLYDNQIPKMLEAYGKGKMVEATNVYSDETGARQVHRAVMPYLPLANAPASYPMFSLSNPGKIASTANDALSESRKKVGEALLALASPRAKGRELYEKYAPQWLSVTSLHHIAQVFGKNVPQIKSMDRHVDDLVTTKTAIIDRAYAIHKAAEKAASDKDGSGVAKFNRAALTGTFNQMTPWAGMFEQDWVPAEGTKADRLKEAAKAWSSAGMNKSTGLTFQEAYRESADAFNALSPMEQIQLQRMVEDTAAIRQRERTNLLKRIELLSEGSPELRKSLMLQFNASFNNLKGMYLPLSRFGDFILEYTNAKGQRVLEAFPDATQRKAVRETLAGEGVDETTVVERVKDKNAAVIAGMPQELMSQLTKSVESKFLAGVDPTDELAMAAARERAQAAVSDMNQTFFRWLPDTSAMKNSVRRKNIQGASDNMLRGYLDYIQRHAVAIAWSEVGSKIEQDIQGLANENAELRKSGLSGEGPVNLDMRVNLLNDMRARVKAIRTTNVGGLWSGISKLNTGYFMTSPSAFFVQMTQIPTLTLPKLGAMFGWGKSSKALAVAGREAFSKKFSAEAMLADPIVNSLYSDIRATVNETNRREGQSLGDPMFSPAQIQVKMRKLSDYQLQLLTLREAMDRNLLDISAAHEAFELTRGGDPDSKMSGLFRTVMLPMQHGELASRKTAVLATLDLALKSGKGLFGKQNQDGTYAPGAIDDIHEVVKGTLFSYAKEDMGAATQGGAIRTILQFQKFRVFTGLRIARLFLESVKGIPSAERAAARKEFVGIMGMSTLIGGVKGTIYAAPIMAIANLLFGWDDDDKPYSAELDFTNWMEETFGKTAGDAIAHGPLTLMGANISRRVGLGDIYGSQAEPPPGLHGAALASWWAGSLLGPTFSVAQGWFKGYDQMMNKGNYMRGLEDASPKPIKDALKAFRFATEGVKTGDGRKILSDDEIGVDELLTTFFGFQSDEVARAQAANAALGKMSTAISERRGRLIRDAAEAILSEDGDIEGAIAAVTRHAQKMPRYAITASEIKGAIAKRIKGEFGVTGERELGVAQDYDIGVLGGGE